MHMCCTGTIVLQAHSGVFTNTVTNNLKIIFTLLCQQSQVQSVKCEGEDASDNKHLNQSKMQKVHEHVYYIHTSIDIYPCNSLHTCTSYHSRRHRCQPLENIIWDSG